MGSSQGGFGGGGEGGGEGREEGEDGKEAEKMEEEELGLAAEMIWTDDWICLVSNSWRSGRWRSCQ